MKKTLTCLATLLVLTAVPLVLAQEKSEEKTKLDPAEWAPADALGYVGVTDVAKTWEDYKKTAAYEMVNDKALAEALPGSNLLGGAVKKLQTRLAKALDVPAEQLKNPFSGPLALYIAAPPGAAFKDVEPGLVASVGDAPLMKKYYDTAVAKLKEYGKHATESAGSNTIDVFTADAEMKAEKKKTAQGKSEEEEEDFSEGGGFNPFQSPDKLIDQGLNKFFSPESMPPKLALCLTADRLIVAGSVEQVKAILNRQKGGQTLAEADDHKALLRHLKPTGSVRVLVNLPRIVEMAKAEAKQDQAEDLQKILKVIGAESLRSVVGHLRVGAESYDSKAEVLFLMSGERAGLAKVLSMDNRPTTPPKTVSAGVSIYAGCNLNVPQLLDQIEKMIRQNDPDAADQMRASMEHVPMPGGQPVNMRSDFLDHLSGPLTLTLAFTKPVGPNCVRFLLALGHKDQNALVRFFGNFGEMMKARDVRGTQVFEGPMMAGMSLAPTSDRLIAGNAAAVESALEPSAGDPLAETDGWKRVARLVPEQAWLTVYVDQRKILEAAAELAGKREELGGAGGPDFGNMMLMGIVESLGAGGDKADPEGVRKLVKYSAPTVYTVSTTTDGVRLTGVQLKPEK